MAVSGDSERLITGSGDNTARVWEVNGGREVGRIETGNGRSCFGFGSERSFPGRRDGRDYEKSAKF